VSAPPLLAVRDVHAGYGATPILFGVSLEVRAGEAVALLGLNGMGKTTLMKTVMGFLRRSRGTIELGGLDMTRLAPHEIARLGVGFVPENRRIFPGLTVRENLELGLSALRDRSAAVRGERLEEVFRHFPRLRERIDQAGKTLSGGEQQMLAIARVMMAGAKLVLMDEPTQGLAPALIRHIRDMIRELKRLGRTVLLVEQNARMALHVCDRGYILEKGAIVFEGPSAELRDSPVTREKLGV
jgi:branched-chain amino acid transport system ATP-binding protein